MYDIINYELKTTHHNKYSTMDTYTELANELDHLLETKYKKNGRFIKFIYNGYKNNNIKEAVSEFSRFLLIDTIAQTMTLTDTSESVILFLQLSREETEELHKDLDILLLRSRNDNNCSSSERMLWLLIQLFFNNER